MEGPLFLVMDLWKPNSVDPSAMVVNVYVGVEASSGPDDTRGMLWIHPAGTTVS